MKGSWQRTIRITLKVLLSYVVLHWKFFLLGLAASFLLVTLTPKLVPFLTPERPPTIGTVGNFTLATLPESVREEISFGLTRITPEGQATSGAALSWEATDSGRTVVFHLDPNLFWQDGTKFDTSQINLELKGVNIKHRALDQIAFELAEPFAPLPAVLSQPLFKSGLVGLGEYKVAGLKTAGRFLENIQLVNIKTGQKKIYKFYPNEATAVTALRLGAVSKIVDLHDPLDLQFENRYAIAGHSAESTVVTLFFNTSQKFLEEKAVRQALTYALPDEFPGGEPAFSPLAKGNWAYNTDVKKYSQNTALARDTLKAATASGTKLQLVTSKSLLPTAEIIASSWISAGQPTQVIISDSLPTSFDAYLSFLEIPPDPDQYALWHSTQRGNLTGFKSARLDRLLEDGRKTLDPRERKQIYLNFQKALAEDVPATFLYYPTLYTIQRK